MVTSPRGRHRTRLDDKHLLSFVEEAEPTPTDTGTRVSGSVVGRGRVCWRARVGTMSVVAGSPALQGGGVRRGGCGAFRGGEYAGRAS
jgi:hypothetical protein